MMKCMTEVSVLRSLDAMNRLVDDMKYSRS